ncbi:MAG TPA: TetR/AcrR family transcriptional regulator [Verrucomicrobiae bacterium]|nr:TetR/AcrR family transcriptional regulator [Verrucomicrobiae bacterium]
MKASKRRSAILASAAPIFNRRGFAGTSIAEILAATSLEKGGLYNHFASKEELAIAAFDYAWNEVNAYFARELHGTAPGMPYLHAYVDAFARYVENPVVEGGCPLVNATLEADDALPFLQERVRAGLAQVQSFVRHQLERAVEKGQLAASLDLAADADFLVATLQGTIVLARGLRSRTAIRNATGALHAWLHALEPS